MAKRKPKRPKLTEPVIEKYQVDGRNVEIVQGGIYRRTFVDGKLDNHELNTGNPYTRESALAYLEMVESVATSRVRSPMPPDEKIHYLARQGFIVCEHLRWIRKQLEAGADPTLVMNAIRLGEHIEKMQVLPHERDAAKGKVATRSAENARESQAEKKQKREQRIVEAVQKHLAANSKNSLTEARRRASKELHKRRGDGYSYDAVLDATKKMKK